MAIYRTATEAAQAIRDGIYAWAAGVHPEAFRALEQSRAWYTPADWAVCGPAEDFGQDDNDMRIAQESGDPALIARCLSARALKGA